MCLLSYRTYCSLYELLSKHNYALFLSFSDLALVGGMLPSVLQTPPPFQVVAEPRTSPALLLELLIAPVILIYASLCRRSTSDDAKTMSILSHHTKVAYAILRYVHTMPHGTVWQGRAAKVVPCRKYMWTLHRLSCGMPFDATWPKNSIGKLSVSSKEAARHRGFKMVSASLRKKSDKVHWSRSTVFVT